METAWLVAFLDQPNRPWGWWDIFTRPGFRHVAAFRLDVATGHWLLVDGTRHGTNVDIATSEEMDKILTIVARLGCVVSVCSTRKNLFSLPAIPLFYCVPLIQRLIGVRGLILTPWQLYGALKKAGGALMFGTQPGGHGGEEEAQEGRRLLDGRLAFWRRRAKPAPARPGGGTPARGACGADGAGREEPQGRRGVG